MISRTPLRVSFAGGGTDLPGFAEEHGGAVLSATIDKYVYVVVHDRFEGTIRVSHTETEIVERPEDIRHGLVRESLAAAGLARGLDIATISDVPERGSGLGSSSALAVGLLHALLGHRGERPSADELAAGACRIEIDVLGRPIGRQDAYASAHGGLQALKFGAGGAVRREPVALPPHQRRRLERNLLLFFTGRQRDAAGVLAEIGERIGRGGSAVATLRRMRDAALELTDGLCRGGDSDLVGHALRESWELKRSLHGSVSNAEVDRAVETALAAGALGGKLLGAGAGGFLLLYVPEERQRRVRAALQSLRELPFRFDSEGSRIVFAGR